MERSQFCNAHFKHPQGRAWIPEDFLDSPDARRRRQQVEEDHHGFTAAKALDARLSREIFAARKDAKRLAELEEQYIPAWARMTPQEKADRGLV